MKKFIPVLFAVLIGTAASAQYKKASFFGREGRTYEFGTTIHAFGDGRSTTPGFKFAFGSDREGKHLFTFYELQYITGIKYAYTTMGDYFAPQPVAVTGKTRGYGWFGVNVGYFILNNDNEKAVKPFVALGANVIYGGFAEDETKDNETRTPDTDYREMETDRRPADYGVSGSLGCMIKLKGRFGIRVNGGYTHMFHLGEQNTEYGKPYNVFDGHPFASFTLRFRTTAE